MDPRADIFSLGAMLYQMVTGRSPFSDATENVEPLPASGAHLGLGRQVLGQHLDRHLAAEPRVAGPVDLAHAARAERPDDLVGSETCLRGENGYRPALDGFQSRTSVIGWRSICCCRGSSV